MTEDLLTFSTDKQGRIRLDQDIELAPIEQPPSCSCRNEGQPFLIEGHWYTSRDPGCRLHGMRMWEPSAQALEAESLENERSLRRLQAEMAVQRDARLLKTKSGRK